MVCIAVKFLKINPGDNCPLTPPEGWVIEPPPISTLMQMTILRKKHYCWDPGKPPFKSEEQVVLVSTFTQVLYLSANLSRSG